MNASVPLLSTAALRITRIRVRNPKVCIFFGYRVDLESGLNDRSNALVVRVPASIAEPKNFEVGELWEIYGETSEITNKFGDYVLTETQIEAQNACLLKPSGSQVIQWLAANIEGVGEVKAQKLWDVNGEQLYQILDSGEHDAITSIIPSEKIRQGLFDEWSKNGDTKTLKFVQERGIPLDLARKTIKFHKKATIDKLLEDPYCMTTIEN